MTEAELVKSLSERFYSDFADTVARRVRDAGAVELLYRVATSSYANLPKPAGHKAAFRSAYVLEKIYFAAPDVFMPFVGAFCDRDFPACTDRSAQRHFAKIMADLLGRYTPDSSSLERIAETAAQWAVDPGTKVAVRIWDDLVETMAHGATPGIECRMRKSWKPGRSDKA